MISFIYFPLVKDPVLEKLHKTVTFDFEGKKLQKSKLRALLVQEAIKFNPKFKEKMKKSGVLDVLDE